ncbi:hypothetical protein RRG08_009851 [Elysia crispata]|uniref:Uncharacterized protein n=1 Tax=Elysia crispata TaxID=231223 RepID=A0AAE1DAL6_9GAST|nr:hypothetical protein RRG08_009851 [Elysia crispata]
MPTSIHRDSTSDSFTDDSFSEGQQFHCRRAPISFDSPITAFQGSKRRQVACTCAARHFGASLRLPVEFDQDLDTSGRIEREKKRVLQSYCSAITCYIYSEKDVETLTKSGNS